MKTRYFNRTIKNGEVSDWQEIKLNKGNWWYVQLNASITTAFYKYGIPDPPAVYVQDILHERGIGLAYGITHIRVFRPEFESNNFKFINKWFEVKLYIAEELKHQAECNSTDDWEYIIEII